MSQSWVNVLPDPSACSSFLCKRDPKGRVDRVDQDHILHAAEGHDWIGECIDLDRWNMDIFFAEKEI